MIKQAIATAGAIISLAVNSFVWADDIQVFFNHPTYSPAIQADLEEKIITFIDSANKTLDMAVYDLDLPGIATAMVNALNRGVTVRFITDEDNVGVENEEALDILNAGNVLWIDDTADGSSGSGIMHNKFIVVDGQAVLTGSTNMTQSGIHGDLDNNGTLLSEGNDNHIVIIESTQLANVFSNQFEQMWGDGPGNANDSLFGLNKADHRVQSVYTTNDQIQIDVQFSPQSPSTYNGSTIETIADLIQKAADQILVAQFVFSAQDVADAMKVRHDDGVEVKGIGDPSFFSRYYSEFNDMLGIAVENTSGSYEVDTYTGAANNIWENPADVRVAALSSYDKFHHKYLVVDDQVMTGSHNISAAASTGNDENIVIIHDAETASEFAGHFNYAFCLAGGSTSCDPSSSIDDAGTWEGVSFSAEEVRTVLDIVNIATLAQLDDDVPLNSRAANNIVSDRPIESMEQLAAVAYIGSSALQALKDYAPYWP